MSEINFLNIIQVIVAVALIIFILIQRGPGATAGSAFGSGASGTVFGAKGSASFLSKTTAILATAFFIITMLIAINASTQFSSVGDVTEQDLGVIGTLDDLDAEPVMVPTEDGQDTLNETTPPVTVDGTDEAGTEAAQQGEVDEPAMSQVDEEVGETANEESQTSDSEDSDGDGN